MDTFDLDQLLQVFVAFATQWGIRATGAVAVLVIGRWAARKVKTVSKGALGRSGIEPMLIPFTTAMIYWGLMAFVLIAVLGLFGIPTASFVAVLGAAGLAIGLALQGTLANFASGIMILTFRPFVVGHSVEVGGTLGTVSEVGMFSTDLNTPDNVRVTVPNSQIYGQTIKNYSQNETRRIDLVIGVGYNDDLDLARNTILGVLRSDSRVLLDPEPVVEVSQLGDSSVDFVVRPWCKQEDYWSLRFNLTRQVKIELEASGCNIPFPQRDIHLHQVA